MTIALSIAGLTLLLPTGTDVYVGLLTAEPDSYAGTYTEVADSGYARQAIDAWTDVDLTGGRGERSNTGAVVFPAIADGNVTITHWAIFDALAAGNMLASSAVLNISGEPEPVTISVPDAPRFNAGDLYFLTAVAP